MLVSNDKEGPLNWAYLWIVVIREVVIVNIITLCARACVRASERVCVCARARVCNRVARNLGRLGIDFRPLKSVSVLMVLMELKHGACGAYDP